MEPALSAKGWLDKLFLYLWDEPVKEARAALLERGRAAGSRPSADSQPGHNSVCSGAGLCCANLGFRWSIA